MSYSSKGATETARILMSAAADLARSEHVPVALARCLSNLTVEFNLDDLDRALETGREAVDVAARSGVAVWRDYTEANLMLALLLSGGWAELDERLAGSQSTSVVAQVIAAGILGSLRAARGEEFAVSWTEGRAPLSDDPSDAAWIGFAAALEAQSRGDLVVASGAAVQAVEVMYGLSGTSDDFVHMWPLAVELAMDTGDGVTRDRLLGIVDADEERLKVPLAVAALRTWFGGRVAAGEDPATAEQPAAPRCQGVHHVGLSALPGPRPGGARRAAPAPRRA